MAKKSDYRTAMDAAEDYAAQARALKETDAADAWELSMMAVDYFGQALKLKPGNPEAERGRNRYQALADRLGKPDHTDGGPRLETALTSVMIAGAFIFSLDLLAPKITGNAVGSGNLPVDMGAGILLLIASVAAMVFLFKPKAPKPMPHPEKKSRKTKAKKSRKK